MHKALNNILEAKWLERIEDNLSGHNIEVSKEKKDNGKWIFICKGDDDQMHGSGYWGNDQILRDVLSD